MEETEKTREKLIPLTEEILAKNMECREITPYKHEYLIHKETDEDDPDIFLEVTVDSDGIFWTAEGECILMRLKYVHQLQNIFTAMEIDRKIVL